MPLLRYFLTVGTILTAVLFAVSAYLESQSPNVAARVSVTPTTASLYIPPPPPAKPVSVPATAAAAMAFAPPAPARHHSKKARH